MSDIRERHGMHSIPEYQIWKAMIKRCENKNAPDYKWYGARGISVCERWRHSFLAFITDVGPRPDGYWIDRVDNTKGYEPRNVRWKTPTQQQRNKSNNHLYFVRGKKLTLKEAHEIHGTVGIGFYAFKSRVRNYGWSVEKALKTPVRRAA